METFIVRPKNNQERNVIKAFLEALKIKFEQSKVEDTESPYDPEFVKMVEEGRAEYKAGKGTKIDIDKLWK